MAIEIVQVGVAGPPGPPGDSGLEARWPTWTSLVRPDQYMFSTEHGGRVIVTAGDLLPFKVGGDKVYLWTSYENLGGGAFLNQFSGGEFYEAPTFALGDSGPYVNLVGAAKGEASALFNSESTPFSVMFTPTGDDYTIFTSPGTESHHVITVGETNGAGFVVNGDNSQSWTFNPLAKNVPHVVTFIVDEDEEATQLHIDDVVVMPPGRHFSGEFIYYNPEVPEEGGYWSQSPNFNPVLSNTIEGGNEVHVLAYMAWQPGEDGYQGEYGIDFHVGAFRQYANNIEYYGVD
jgi:signal peptidase I